MRTLTEIVQAAHACAGARDRAAIGWAELFAWPAWALPAHRAALDRRVLGGGALRHADALRACIDGPTLQAASELLGRATLLALLQGPVPKLAQLAALPRAEALAPHWRRAGRAQLAAGVAAGVLRNAVLDHLEWRDTDAAEAVACDADELTAWLLALAVDAQARSS
jgi:hypothetical protein